MYVMAFTVAGLIYVKREVGELRLVGSHVSARVNNRFGTHQATHNCTS